MILDDQVTLLAGDPPEAPAYVVAAHVGSMSSALVDVGGGLIADMRITVAVPLPLSDPVTGAPYGITVDQITRIRQGSRQWTVGPDPLISRRHGVDHHARWTVSD